MVLFVGDKPSPRMKPGAKPFEGAACEKRLMEWICYLLDMTELEFIINPYVYRIINRTDEDAVFVAHEITLSGGKIITLGDKASDFMRDINIVSMSGTRYFYLPHPSRRNRQINDKKFIESKLKACKEWLKEMNVYKI